MAQRPWLDYYGLLQLGLVGLFSLGYERSKSRGVVDRNVRQDLSVQIDTGALEPVDELTVRDLGHAAGGIDSNDPERAEVPLLQPAADIAITQRFLDGFLGRSIQLGLCEEKTLGSSKGLVAIVSPIGTSFDSWHVFSFFNLDAGALGREKTGTCGALLLLENLLTA